MEGADIENAVVCAEEEETRALDIEVPAFP
jgi:hypothetical protein